MRSASDLAALVLLAALGACNQTYGLEPTRVVDAAFFDSPLDAPFACPPVGSEPVFATDYQQGVLQDCHDFSYSATTGLGLAACRDDLGRSFVAEGPLAGPLVPAPGFDGTTTFFDRPRLGANGDVALVGAEDRVTHARMIATYRRDPLGWTRAEDFAPGYAVGSYSTPSAGPTPHVLVFEVRPMNLPTVLHELELAPAGTWREVVPAPSIDALALTSAYGIPQLTPDGLRLVLAAIGAGGAGVYYSDRPSLAAPFRAAVRLGPGSEGQDPFMLDDCSRLYFNAVGSLFYAQQR